MNKPFPIVLGLILMVAIIVAMDVAFFRNYFWARLAANIGTVLIFAALYLRFFK